MKYPVKLTHNGKVVLSLRKDEVTFQNEEPVYEIADATERMFWELSNNKLNKLKSDLKNGKIIDDTRFAFDFIQMVEKILAQRKFIQDNQSFRNALIPE